jgi:L,D-transpeptidase YcbB
MTRHLPRSFGVAAFILTALALGGLQACRTTRTASFDDQVLDILRARLLDVERNAIFCVGAIDLWSGSYLWDFYNRREGRPVWIRGGVITPEAAAVLAAIRASWAEGLDPSDYHYDELARLAAGIHTTPIVGMAEHWTSAPAAADFDMILTDAFLLLASHYADGKVDQDATKARWAARSMRIDPVEVLERGLLEKDPSAALTRLLPQHGYYAALKKGYARYRGLAEGGGWAPLPAGPALQMGTKDNRVAVLRSRLAAESGEPGPTPKAPDIFDEALARAVCAFQQRHSLPTTGLVDEGTRATLNVSASERARQIALNLERWRWLPSDFGASYVLVDVSAFELSVFERGVELMRMKIVAGTTAWPTPCFASIMTDFVINPSWLAPQSVLAKELVNYMKADPNYLPSNKMFLFRGWGEEEFLLDPKAIDFGAVTAANLDFHLVQMPGPANVLGRFKFSHPNRYDIYLHDTPYQSDFGQPIRTFSHGCIRIARPLEFALFLLDGNRYWTAERLLAKADSEEEGMILVRKRVDVIVFSGTAWALVDGSIHFRPDIYIADGWLAEALAEKPHAEVWVEPGKTASKAAKGK